MSELYPSLAATQQQVEDERATKKITANDKFCLIKVIFFRKACQNCIE
jgi:hypothetical protein